MNQPNPAWKPLLDKLPPALHPMVMPVLEEWDKGVQQKFTEIREEYKPYEAFKPFVENNITADFAWESVVFADQLQREPAKVAEQINSAFNLEYISKADHEKALADASASSSGSEELFENEDGTKLDLSKIPEFANLKQTLETIQSQSEEEKRKAQEQEALDEFNAELDALEKAVTEPEDGSQGKPFNRTVITAFMSQGLSGEDAVKEFHKLLGANASTETPSTSTTNTDAPVTMGNSGNAGSGVGQEEVKWAEMSNSDFNANVAKVLEAQLKQG